VQIARYCSGQPSLSAAARGWLSADQKIKTSSNRRDLLRRAASANLFGHLYRPSWRDLKLGMSFCSEHSKEEGPAKPAPDIGKASTAISNWIRFMECLNCHADNPESGRFCTQCGAALPAKCIQCGAVNLPKSRFCGSCGANLAATRASNGFTPATSRPPPTSETSIISGSERRHLTVLFCDIVGSTSLDKSLDPEDINDLTRRYSDCWTVA